MLFFHQLKNHILNDHLSDWFEKVNTIDNTLYHKNELNDFAIELIKHKKEYKQMFFDIFNNKYNHYVMNDLNQEQILYHIKYGHKHIFLNSELYHKEYNIYVKPDIIIHRDIFNEIFFNIEEDLPEYIILDILYNILHISSDKDDILNQGNIYYHKCKISIASLCITNNNYGYFLAKEYRHKNNTLEKKKNNR